MAKEHQEQAHELLLTIEAADFLRVSRATFGRFMRKGDFPKPILLGYRSKRWKRSDLLAWAEKTRDTSAAA